MHVVEVGYANMYKRSVVQAGCKGADDEPTPQYNMLG